MLPSRPQQVPHGGGLRFEMDSAYYNTICMDREGARSAIRRRTPSRKLEVTPPEILLPKPGRPPAAKVTAHYADGSTRDVTAKPPSIATRPTIAEVGNAAVVKAVRKGEATMLVRYEGKFSTLPVTVVNRSRASSGPASAEQLHRPVHRRQAAAREDSAFAVIDDAEFLRRVSSI